jgi:PKD repeat protein
MEGRCLGGVRAALTELCVLVAVILLAEVVIASAAAIASPTTVGFDNLAVGTLVANQYESSGLKLGSSGEFAGFQTKLEKGDCGPPSVGSGAQPAASEPNYATLAVCKGGPASGPTQYFRGTFGALTPNPGKSLAVDLRLLAVGVPNESVKLTTYNSAGQEVQSAEGEATATEWKRLAVTLAGAAQISYFSISTVKSTTTSANSPGLAIDNLGFEVTETAKKEEPKKEEPKKEVGKEKEPTKEEPNKGGSSQPPSGGGTPPTPPTATLSLGTPNPSAGQPITLSGAGSAPGSGHIISYGWNFKGGSTTETSTGTNPIAHVMLGPGAHTVALTVTNSTGEHSTTRFGLTLPSVKIHPNDGGEGECLPTLEIGEAHLLAECIQKQGSGYVIAGPQLQINGLVLVPTNGFLRIKNNPYIVAGGSAVELYGATVQVELPNTPIGDMVLGGRDLEAEPVLLEVKAHGLPKFEGIFDGLVAPAAHAADEESTSKSLLMAFGVGKECKSGEKKAACCPPKNGVTSCATLPGDFPLTGQVDVYLNKKDQALINVQVGLSLKDVNFEATGALEIRAGLETGIELQSLKFEIGEASLAPIFKVKSATFEYFFPEYEEESKRDSWQAKATITFGENIAELEAELAFKHGEFQSAGMKFKANPGVAIYPGIFLNEIGASVGVNPLTFGGSLGASIAEVLGLELEFKYREETEKELGFFGGKGTLSLKEHKIATLAADVYSDGYTDAELKVHFQVPFEPQEAFASIEGEIGFWDEPNTGKWEADGRVAGKIWIIEAEIAGLVNNHYVAGCGDIHVVFTVSGFAFYDFQNGESGFEGFVHSCKERLEPYKEHPAVKHSGGFVGGESAVFPAAQPLARAAAAGESDTVNLPGSPRGEDLRITSSSGSPIVTLVGPGGQTYTTPSTVGHPTSDGSQFVGALGPSPNQVTVFLVKPQRGQWRVEPAPGSGPISKIEGAGVAPPPAIRVHVHHRGKAWTLAYRIGHYTPATKVQLLERGRDSDHLLATIAAARGLVRFTPQEALGRQRQIIATVLGAKGEPLQTLKVGDYLAPGAFRPGRARRVRITRQRSSALASWTAVAGASSYLIKVRGSDGRLETLFRKPSQRSVSIPNVLGFESFTVTVTAIGGKDRLAGPSAIGKLAPVKVSRSRAPRPAKAKHHKRK